LCWFNNKESLCIAHKVEHNYISPSSTVRIQLQLEYVRDAGYSLQPRHYSSLPAPNLEPTANQERNDQCGNQHYSRELLMMDIVVPETC
jgi:hypothetical protein